MTGSDRGRRGRSSDGRRPTKAERRDEARLKREEIQRRMARRRRNRSIGIALVAGAVATVVAVVFLTSGGSESSSGIPSPDTLLAQAEAARKSAGCDAVEATPNFANAPGDDPTIDHAHIGSAPEIATPPPLSTYPTIPPASGPHDPAPLPAGVYDSPPSVYQALHALEHGGVIVWYSPDADAAAVADLKEFYGQRLSEVNLGQDRVIVAPYDYPGDGEAGRLPAGVQMALVAWHRLQTCAKVSLPVAFDFTSQYEFPPYDGRQYKGVAREPGGVM